MHQVLVYVIEVESYHVSRQAQEPFKLIGAKVDRVSKLLEKLLIYYTTQQENSVDVR